MSTERKMMGRKVAGGIGLLSGAAVVLALVFVSAAAFAASVDFKATNWAAAEPHSYDHLVGGGAFDDSTSNVDTVESLEGGDFYCGDLVSYLIKFQMEQSVVDPVQSVVFKIRLLADTTGQTGAAQLAIPYVGVNYGKVVGGDGPGGTDSAIFDDGGSTATLLATYFDPATGPFVNGTDLVAEILLTDLEAGETVIVRMDAMIGCKQYTNPTGNLQGELDSIRIVQPATNETVNAGNQTIPFQRADEIIGAGEPALRVMKTVTTEDGQCPGAETMDAYSGGTVKYCYEIRNVGTADLMDAKFRDDNGTPANAGDDFLVPLVGLADSAYDRDTLVDDLLSGAVAQGSAIRTVTGEVGRVIVNVGLASGTNGANNPTWYYGSDTASVTIIENPLPPASISLDTKASLSPDCSDALDPMTAAEGATVYFCYFITNTGGQVVGEIWISDPGINVPGSISLAPGASGLLVSDALILGAEELMSDAVATGIALSGDTVEAADPALVYSVSTRLTLEVKASLDAICGNADDQELLTILEGTTVYYCYYVTNAGESFVSGITIDDPLAYVPGSASLAAGESFVFMSDPVIEYASVIHAALASGTDAFGALTDSNVDTAGVEVVHPALTIIKTVSLDGSCPGLKLVTVLPATQVVYCYEVINSGDTDISGITVKDGDVTIAIGDLPAGGSIMVSSDPISATEDMYTEATASGTDNATGTPVKSEPDGAAVDVVHPALNISVTVSLTGTCPGVEIVNVLENTDVLWCYEVKNTGDVAVNGITIDSDLFGTLPATFDLLPGESLFLSTPDPAVMDDGTMVASASGMADLTIDSPVVSNEDPAAVNVVHPGLTVDVTISLDGTCPGVDSTTVISGTYVTYCYEVTNLGDTTVCGIELVDDVLGAIDTGDYAMADTGKCLTPGGSVFFSVPDVLITEDLTNTVYASGTDEFGFPVSDGDTATIDAIKADLWIDKQAPATVLTSQGNTLTYTLIVGNSGEAIGFNTVVSDTLPAGLTLISMSAGCLASGATVTCALGDVAPGQTVTITIVTKVIVPLARLTNTAYVSSDTPDSNPANNQDSATTQVGPGATRTIGFYSTHPDFVAICLDWNWGTIDLGFVKLANESIDNQIDVDVDKDIETGLELAMGILNANVTRFVDKSLRSELAKARMQAGRQVLAAFCNENMLGSDFSIDFAAARTILAGTSISAILQLSAQADAFNNSGDPIALGFNPGPAVSKYPWDDPTDPKD